MADIKLEWWPASCRNKWASEYAFAMKGIFCCLANVLDGRAPLFIAIIGVAQPKQEAGMHRGKETPALFPRQGMTAQRPKRLPLACQGVKSSGAKCDYGNRPHEIDFFIQPPAIMDYLSRRWPLMKPSFSTLDEFESLHRIC